MPPAEVFLRFGKLLCHFCSNWNSNRNFLTVTESSWWWSIHRFTFQAFTVTGTLCNRHRHNAKKKEMLEEKFFLFLPMQMKGNDTMLPKRSHIIILFTVKSAKDMLRPSGLTSERHYCSSQHDICVVIIGCYDRMKRSSMLHLSGRIWLMKTEYPACSLVLLKTEVFLPEKPSYIPLAWLNHCVFFTF